MIKIPIEGKNTKRHLCLNFDIDSTVSYEDFCRNKNHEFYTEIIDSNYVLDGFRYIGNLFYFSIVRDMYYTLGIDTERKKDNFLKLIGLLFSYDINETFQNLSDVKVNKIQKIIDNDIEFNFTEDILDLIPILLGGDFGVPYFGNDLFIEDILKEKKVIEKIMLELSDISYNVVKKPNKRLFYTIFQILAQKEDVFFVFNGANNFVVCTSASLSKNIISVSIVKNLTSFLYENMSIGLKEKILELKGKYQSNMLNVYLKEIIEQFETIKNIEIKTLSKEFDTNKRGDIDKNLPNADIGFKKHKGEKKYIKIERTFKLKKK